MSNLLFICSMNLWRSPTAEMLFKGHAVHHARSAGTGEKARIKVNEKLLAWADELFVMERKHRDLLEQRFPEAMAGKLVTVLYIADDYKYGDEELIITLKQALDGYL